MKASVDDLRWLAPGSEPVAAARVVLESGPKVVLLTDGSGPVRVVDGGEVSGLPVPAVEVADTVGAGDAFGAGFLASWHLAGLRRGDLADRARVLAATRLAIRVGSATTTRAGAEPPTAAELDRLVPA